jgi:hypothetical protein
MELNAFNVKAQLAEVSRRALKDLIGVVEQAEVAAMQRESDAAGPLNEDTEKSLAAKSEAAQAAIAAYDSEGRRLLMVRCFWSPSVALL